MGRAASGGSAEARHPISTSISTGFFRKPWAPPARVFDRVAASVSEVMKIIGEGLPSAFSRACRSRPVMPPSGRRRPCSQPRPGQEMPGTPRPKRRAR
jgi:hypothetical protein